MTSDEKQQQALSGVFVKPGMITMITTSYWTFSLKASSRTSSLEQKKVFG